MLVTVQRITASLELAARDPAKPPPLPQTVLKKAAGPEMVLPASVARLERAADDHQRRIASMGARGRRVAPRPSAGSAISGSPLLSTAGSHAGGGGGSADPHRAIRMSRGEPLSGSVLGSLESHFGRSLGDVRVHTDPAAGEAARGMNARAFALGSHIYFARGQFNPNTPAGLGLIGHEVAHVDQFHRGLSGLGATRAKSLGLNVGSDRLERFADDHARRISGLGAASGGAIESFSIDCGTELGPAVQAALTRIAEHAVARAADELGRERTIAIVEKLRLQTGVDVTGPEEREVQLLASKIVRAARRQATAIGGVPTSSGSAQVVQLARFVADSGLFMDRFEDPNEEALRDAILIDREHTLLITSAVHREVARSASRSQNRRVAGTLLPGAHRDPVGAREQQRIESTAGSLAKIPGILTGAFGRNDLEYVVAATIFDVPLVTTNPALVDQAGRDVIPEQYRAHVMFLPQSAGIQQQIDQRRRQETVRRAINDATAELRAAKNGLEDEGQRARREGRRDEGQRLLEAALAEYERIQAELGAVIGAGPVDAEAQQAATELETRIGAHITRARRALAPRPALPTPP